MSKAQDETCSARNGPVSGQVQAVNKSPSVSDSSDGGEEEIDEDSALEYILRGKQDVLTSKIMLPSGSTGAGNDMRTKIDPDTQARLEALLEAAGVAKLADGKAFADPDVLRRLTSSVSSALDEAAAALTRMRTQNNGVPTSPNHTTDAGIHSLANACLEGNVNAVRKLLEQGWSVHDSTDEGESLLSLACSAGYCELAQVLLAMNAKVDDRGNKGDCTPLMEASSGGFADIVQLLLDHGADVNAQSQAGNTALIYACCGGYENVVKVLLDHGALIEAHNENGHTPLMEAASGGHVNVAKLLLERGACINSHSNEFKESALTLACYKGHVDMVKFLLDAGADQEHKTDEMHTALMEASMDGHVEVARLLLDHGAEVNMPADSFESPLTLAACGGHVELASLLIDREAFLEEVNDEGYTPLMEAAREGHLDMVALLLERGADIHAQTEETQETALSLTCCGGFQDVAAFLLDRGAKIEQGSSTPLMEASQEGHVDLVKFLLSKGANVNATTATGDTPLSFACENGHTDVADILLEAGAELEHESEGGRTPLMKAARAGHLCTVQFLISRGADVNRATTTNDHTVLSLACAGGYLAVVELLLAHGAKPDHILKDNSTMLLEACKGGHTAVAKLLLDTPLNVSPQEYPFASIQPPLSPSSPPRVPPVHSLDQVDPILPLPGLNCTHHDLLTSSSLDIMVPPGMLPAGVPLTNEKLEFLSSNLYKSALLNDIPREMTALTPEEQHCIESELARAKQEGVEVTTPPSPFRLDPASVDVETTVVEEHDLGASAVDLGMVTRKVANGGDEEETPSNYVGSSSTPFAPAPSPASPTFEPAIEIEQQTDSNHDTALSVAAAGGHDDLVNLLLSRGAELEHRDKKGCTPLILAATAGHASTVQLLLDNEADIEAQSDRTKDTALSLACSGGRQEVVDVLIAGNANFEHRNVSDYTPLSLAASGGYIGIVKILLAHGAEINSRTGSKLGISPLMLAAMNGHTATVKLLLDMGADINAQIETNRNTALTLACFQGRHEVVSLLVERKANIEHRAKTGLTPLMEAASGGYVDVGRVLLDKGADVNAPPVPSSRDTALTIAADKGHQKFCDLLLSRGAIVEVRNKKGSTPLWLAANGGHLEVCQLLVRYGSDVNSQDNRKVSVLMAAFRKGHVKTVKWLVRHVTQFPSESDTARFISTLSDKELLKKCQTCMGVIRHAKDRQEAEAEKNASILLEQLDMEKEREEVKKQAAARRREKKKKKKKKLKQAGSVDKSTEKEEEGEEEEEEIKENVEKKQEHQVEVNGNVSTEKVPLTNASGAKTEAMDALTSIAITSAIASNVASNHVDKVYVVTTTEITKAMASTMYTSTAKISDMSPITVATAAAQCLTVTLTTNTSPVMSSSAVHSRPKSSPGSRRGRKHDEGWNVVIRRSKKLSVPSSVISRVIGRGGCNVNAIRDATGAHIDIDTSNQKVTGTCTVTIKGPVEATRQAHHLILTLIKDPDCDINDHLPRPKPTLSTSTSYPLSFNSPPVADNTVQDNGRLTRTPVTTASTRLASCPQAIPVCSETVRVRSNSEKRSCPASTAASSSHLPGYARWASPTYQAPTKTAQTVETTASVKPTVSEKQPTSVAKASQASRSPAARQLVFSKSTSPITVPTTTTTRVTTAAEYRHSKPLSYSRVAGGVVCTSGENQVEDGVNGTALPPVISNILSQVCQSPIVWNERFYPTSANCNEAEDTREGSGESHELSQPLTVATSGGLFKPLPHEVSPPNLSGTSPASSSSSTVNTTPSPPAAVPLGTEDSEKPCIIRPIGTERAHRRTNTSPSPNVTGVTPLIPTEGSGGRSDNVWSYYPNPTSVSSWPTATLDNRPMPSVSVVGIESSTSPRPIPSTAIPPSAMPSSLPTHSGDTLQNFLDRLGLLNYLGLFQNNEIDLEALLLMNETDYAEIGLPKGPSAKLLNCTRRMFNQQEIMRQEYRPEYRPGVARPNYRTIPSPPIRPNVSWRQSLPNRPVLHPHGLPNGSLPSNNPDSYNGGHTGGVWNSWSRTAI